MNPAPSSTKNALAVAAPDTEAVGLAEALETHGAVRLPRLVSDETLKDMQAAFASRLRFFRFNHVDGYERTERKRLMVEDALTLAQGFVDIALHPLVTAVLDKYCGPRYELCEAKGWQTQPTKKDFHGWHGDAWYDQTKFTDSIPREVKLAFYLTDVKSGAFQYIRGSHGKRAPYMLERSDVQKLPPETLMDFLGPAGTALLFDTSGIHRQGIPILEPRRAVFYNYHDPDVPLQKGDVKFYRYHPLLLNAALLGGQTPEQMRILGFGNKTNYQPYFVREPSHPRFHGFVRTAQATLLHLDYWSSRVFNRLARAFTKRT
jgi:ectoine hydroxylase-related dioxygenase (phytanoyl-CoA dioxygenase family)